MHSILARFSEYLGKRPLVVCIRLAVLVTVLLSLNDIVGPNSMPFSDGYPYTKRAFMLYGYLHSGQWSAFWNALTVPSGATLFPPHYTIFFLLPSFLAGITAYGIILGLSSYLILAVGVASLCQTLDREEWAVPLYLACVCQNFSLDNIYFYYYTDIPFYAVGTLALAMQIRAWKAGTLFASFVSGALAGYMFWIKPANAVIFALSYFCAELVRAGIFFFKNHRAKVDSEQTKRFVRHIGGVLLGFLSWPRRPFIAED